MSVVSLNRAAAICAAFLAVSLPRLAAQDTRTVTEPSFPASSCAVLAAQLATVNNDLAAASETSFDTSRIQNAINNCSAGQAVELALGSSGNNAFLIQPITLAAGVTLLVDPGVTVFASRNPRDYDVQSGSCGIVASSSPGCQPVISLSSVSNSAVMGFGTINGRGGDTLLGAGAPANTSWWDLANQAQTESLTQFVPQLINIKASNNITLYKITLTNSPTFHVKANNVAGFTVWGIKIIAPYTARNTDGVDPSDCTNVTITESYISEGDDQIAVGAANSGISNVSITNDHLNTGHGVSIGSYTNGGVGNMLVDTVMMAGNAADSNENGIRIKSADDRGGTVSNITYQNMCIENMGYSIQFNPLYNTNTGTLIPYFQSITLNNIHVLTGGKGDVELDGASAQLPLGLTLNNVVFDTTPTITPASQYANITLGAGPVSTSLTNNLSGTGVTVTNNITNPSEAPFSCTNAFVYLAGELTGPPAAVDTAPVANLIAIVEPVVSGAATPTGTVQIMEGGNVVGTAQLFGSSDLVNIALTNVTAGSHSYSAVYSGDSNYAALTFGSFTVAVNTPALAVSQTGVSGVPTSVSYGASIPVMVQVAGSGVTPTGSVEILLGNAVLATVPLSAGSASYSIAGLPAGAYSVSAAYLGDTNYSPSTSGASPVTVVPAATTTSLTSSASQVSFGNTATLTAQVTSLGGIPSGTVAFFDGSTQIGTAALSGGSAVISAGLAVGVHSITASYVATQNFGASTSSAVSITVTTAAALTLSVLPAPLPYTISTIAGGAASNCSGETDTLGDGCPATQVALTTGMDVRGVAADTFGNVYFTDSSNSRIREINAVTGILSTKAGGGTACSSKTDNYGDGCPASQTVLNGPRGVWADIANNIFIAGYNDSLVHEIQASTGKMTMVAGALTATTGSGTGVVGTGADGVPAKTSALSKPRAVWTDLNGNVYIADTGNNKIRAVYAAGLLPNLPTPAIGDIYTLAGTGTAGTPSTKGDKGIATSALLNTPQGGFTDVNGNVFIADGGDACVRVIYMAGATVANLIATENPGTTAQVGFIYTIAGGGSTGVSDTPQLATSLSLGTPQKLAMDAGGNLYFGDSSRNDVFFLDIRSGYLRILAGGASSVCAAHTDAMGDGCPATQATINSGGNGFGAALDHAGNLYVSDTGNLRIRKVSTGAVFGATGIGSSKSQTMQVHFIVGDTPVSSGTFTLPFGQADFAAIPTLPCTSQPDTTTDCLVSLQFSPVVPGERMVPLTIASTLGSVAYIGLTGIGNGAGGAIDPATQLSIGSSLTPLGVAVDSIENVYVSDSSSGSVLKYTAGSSSSTMLANGFVTPSGLAVDAAGAVYVADPGAGQVKRIAPAGTISPVGSNLTTPASVAVDLNGNIYIADSSQSSIIEVSSAFTAQTTIGSGFSAPSSVAVDSAFNVYVADPVAGKVTKITPAGVSTVVATGASTPTAVAVDAAGNLYVADAATLAVILVPATSGPATAIYSNLISPRAVSVDGVGNVYVADSGMTDVVELARTQGLLALPNTTTALTATLSSIGNQPITPTGSGFSQTDSADFSLSGSGSAGCSFAGQIAAGAACTLTAAFTPQTAGTLTDTVTLTGNYSNVALANPQSLQLTLTGNNVVTNVSGSVNVVQAGLFYNTVKHSAAQTVTITNTGANAIAGPLQLVLSGLPSTVTAANSTGTFQGNPFWTVSGASLAPGASVQVTVQFSVPVRTNFSTVPTVYSGVL